MPAIIIVTFGPEWPATVAALGVIERKIPFDMHGSVRAATQRGVAKAKAKALTIPAHGPKHRGTRRTLSRGTTSHRTKYGYRAMVVMPPGEEMLPRGFESQWHHPVFGHSPNVIQHSHYPWFTGPFSEEYGTLSRDLINNLQDAARTVDRAS